MIELQTSRTARALVRGDKHPEAQGHRKAAYPPRLPTAIGLAICRKYASLSLGRDYARRDTQLTLVPANGIDVDDWPTASMTVLRGVESRSSIARAARHGISFVSDR